MKKRLLTLLLAVVLVLTMASCGETNPVESTETPVASTETEAVSTEIEATSTENQSDESTSIDTPSTNSEEESTSEIVSTEEKEVPTVKYSRIACVGDSLTESAPAYPYYLEEILGTSVTIGNFGKSGASLTTYTNNDSYGCYKVFGKEQYEASLEFDADLVIIMIGSNDSTKVENGSPKYDWNEVTPVFKREYLALIPEYKAAYPDADIVLMTSPGVIANNRLKISDDIIENNIYPLQLEVAQETGVKLIDLRAYIKGHSNKEALYRKDKTHFNEYGARLVAEFVISELQEAK